jgi:UTP--glucose-1-phosphate uridylyltransferase
MKPVRKAVLPAAGFGTRMLPVTKVIPKELLPVAGRPVIHYVVEEAVAAGITDILIVISRGKEAIADYFDRAPELESRLEQAGKHDLAAELRRISSLARFHYVRQPEMKGLGDAVLLAREHVGDDPFALLLADTIIAPRADAPRTDGSPLSAMTAACARFGTGVVAVESVREDRVSRYGIVGGEEIEPGVFRVDGMVEKPAAAVAPKLRRLDGSSGFTAFAARYVLPASIFAALEKTPPGKNGEIQLTDAMEAVRRAEGFHAVQLPGRRLDVGDPQGLIDANLALLGRL